MLDHPIASLGPTKGPVLAQKGPFGGPGHPLGPELVPTANGWSNWVDCIHILCLGPSRDLYGTLGSPKRARFGPKGLLLRPRTSSDSPREPDLVPNGVPNSQMTPITQHSAGRDVI